MQNTHLIAYIPVIHQGYIEFLRKHYQKIGSIQLLAESFVDEHKFLEREIRALTPSTILHILRGLGFLRTRMLYQKDLSLFDGQRIIMPNEGIMHRFAEKYLQKSTIEYDRTFLRWDETHVSSQTPVTFDRVSEHPQDRAFMKLAQGEGEKSSDWWRRVGAIIPLTSPNSHSCSDSDLLAHNQHMPSEYSPYAYGDIRDFIPAGQQSDISSAMHAEEAIICEAANRGIPLRGKYIYTSVFPCAPCAKRIVRAGIEKCFYGSGHASFDGEKNLKAHNVEIIYVK